MSNYPLGTEYDSNAPFNQKESNFEYVGLYEDILATGELTYETSELLSEFAKKREEAIQEIIKLIEVAESLENSYFKNKLNKIKKLIYEPTLYIE